MHLFAADSVNAPSVNSPDFWKRPERVTASNDPDIATAQTIRIMCDHVKAAAVDAGLDSFPDHRPMVQETAADASIRFAGLGGIPSSSSNTYPLASSAWWWCKTFIKLVYHENILRARLGESGHLQGLISPEVLVRMDQPEGDCAIFSECICAFLRIFGVPYELVTVAVNPNEPDVFSHVYVYAVMPDGSRLPLDASHGEYPGWQVPSSDVFRRQVWDDSGNPVPDRGSRFDGLHNYGFRGWRGLGDVCDPTAADYDPGVCEGAGGGPGFGPLCPAGMIQSGNSCSFPVGSGSSAPPFFDSSNAPYSGPVYTAPSQNSAQWAQFAASLAKGGMTLAEINAIQPGTVVSANGAILRQNPGYSVPVPGTSLSTSFSNLTSGSTPLLIGGGLLVLVLFGMMAGKK